ncbi:MAG: tyrosine-type recombinase/integrase [Acidobacteriota bacterium]
MEAGKHIGRSEKDLTVPDLMDRYVADMERRNRVSVSSVRSQIIPIKAAFERVLAAAVKPKRIAEFTDERRAAADADATINRRLEALRAALRWAVRTEALRSAPHITLLTEDNARTGFFERAEFDAVEANLPDPVNDIARLAYIVGWRKGRITPLPWTHVDREAREIRPPGYQSINKKTSIVGYVEGDEIDTLIERRYKTRSFSEFVFCWPAGHRNAGQRVIDIKKAWKVACRAAGVPDRLFHDLRRTAVRDMVRSGVPESVAMKISGHKTRSMFARYDIVDLEDQRAALRQVAQYRSAQTTKKKVVALHSRESF